jgi:hypothetical protein
MKPIAKNAKQYARQLDIARCDLHDQVKRAIAEILDEHGTDINCFTFHLELKNRFPFAEPWHLTEGHILTEIEGNYYDKSGLVMHRMDPLQFERAFEWGKE